MGTLTTKRVRAIFANLRLPLTGFMAATALLIMVITMASCQADQLVQAETDGSNAEESQSLVIYSGRSENLVGPLIDQFTEETGIDTAVRYGGTAELAAIIMEEGDNSPADVFFGQDAGALGALAKAQRLVALPDDILQQTQTAFHGASGQWVGVSGRARVLVYNTDMVPESDLPASIWELTDPKWRGKVGWAPTNGSFQAFVTALRVLEGDERAAEWVKAMIDNDVQAYPNNTAIVDAVGAGEIEAGLVNHYYLYRFLAEQGPDFPARNHYFTAGDAGSMINVAGAGILDTAANPDAARRFIEYLLSAEAQQYFADETREYPLAHVDVETAPDLVPLTEINTPPLDLNDLDDLEGTLKLLYSSGALD